MKRGCPPHGKPPTSESGVSAGTDGRRRIWNGPAPADVRPPIKDQHWYTITNLGQNAAEIWVYAEIGGWGITAEGLVTELAALNVSEITVRLNSPGGDVFDGIAIMNALRDHPANVVVKVDALAASIASVIAQAGNKIIMGRNSMMMIHNASGFAMGESKDLRKMAELLESTTANIADVYAERAGGKAKDWLTAMAAETWYSAEEAVAAGLADEVAPMPTEREAHQQAARFDLSVYNHAPAIEEVPGWEGTVGPGPGQYADPHVYARDTQSGSGNCVCGGAPTDKLHVPSPLAPDTGPSLFPPLETSSEWAGPIAWDPDAFRTAMASALPQQVAWDPDVFRTAVAMATTDTPSVPPTPAPAPAVVGFDPNIFALAMREVRRS